MNIMKVSFNRAMDKKRYGTYMRSVQKVSSHVIGKIETLIEEDTRYKKHCT